MQDTNLKKCGKYLNIRQNRGQYKKILLRIIKNVS